MSENEIGQTQDRPTTNAEKPARRKRQAMSEAEAREHWERQVKRGKGMAYCGYSFRSIPADPLPSGFFLVHNRSAFCDNGFYGFRAWVQKDDQDLVPCGCNFGGLRTRAGRLVSDAEVPKHYMIRRKDAGSD